MLLSRRNSEGDKDDESMHLWVREETANNLLTGEDAGFLPRVEDFSDNMDAEVAENLFASIASEYVDCKALVSYLFVHSYIQGVIANCFFKSRWSKIPVCTVKAQMYS